MHMYTKHEILVCIFNMTYWAFIIEKGLIKIYKHIKTQHDATLNTKKNIEINIFIYCFIIEYLFNL